jgi:hypothetical protein
MLTYSVITIQIEKELKKAKVMALFCEKQYNALRANKDGA